MRGTSMTWPSQRQDSILLYIGVDRVATYFVLLFLFCVYFPEQKARHATAHPQAVTSTPTGKKLYQLAFVPLLQLDLYNS